MRRFAATVLPALLLCTGALGTATLAHAADVNVTAAMQACSSDADCTIADGQCGNSCSSVPLASKFRPAFESQKTAACGAPAADEPACSTKPALTASCINSRCTIGTAYQEHASAGDYAPGQWKVSRAQVTTGAPLASQMASVMPAAGDADADSDSSSVKQTTGSRGNGFTAYDLPDHGASTSGTLGTMSGQ